MAEIAAKAEAITVSGGYVYIVDTWRGFEVFDVKNFQPVGLVALPEGSWWGLAVRGDYAYLAGRTLEVIDVSQPSDPRRVGSCPGLGGGHGARIAVSDALAWVVEGRLLRIFNIADPTNPHWAGECVLTGGDKLDPIADVAIAADYAYVAEGGAGVEVFDIRDPAHPRRVGGNTAFDANALAIADGRLHVAAGEQGLVILNLYQPPRFEALNVGSDGFQLSLRGVTGQMMRVERSRDLRTWDPFAIVPIPASGQTLIDPAATTEPFLFYRAVSPP